MSDNIDVESLDLSDRQLLEVLKNHGIDRRLLMKAVGGGVGTVALGGTAAGAGGDNSASRIDENFGAPYSADDTVPEGLPDHTVTLQVAPNPDHPNFPLAPDDTVDRNPDKKGVQGDDDDDPDELPVEFFFDPVGLSVRPGDVVEFKVMSGGQTVTSFHEKFHFPGFHWHDRVPTDHGFTSPGDIVNHDGAESWLYRFSEAGTYDLFCFPHVPLGMVMRIVASKPGDDGSGFEDYGPLDTDPTGNPSRVLDDDQLDPTNIVAEGEIGWGDLSL